MTPPVGTSEGCHIRAQACDSRLCVLLYSMQIRPHCRRHPDFTLRYRRQASGTPKGATSRPEAGREGRRALAED